MPPSGDWEGLLFFTVAALVTIVIDYLRRWVAAKADELRDRKKAQKEAEEKGEK